MSDDQTILVFDQLYRLRSDGWLWHREHDSLWYGPCATLDAAILARREEIAIDAERAKAARCRKRSALPLYLIPALLLVLPLGDAVLWGPTLVFIATWWVITLAWEIGLFMTVGNRCAK
jgi:hypothetical protein